jgi:hypothetical protein
MNAITANIVIFLQNAWSPFYANGTWPRRSWLHALEQSRSGQRLKLLIDDFDVCENTTPIVGATPDSVVRPDMAHIQEILERRRPSVVVACGRQAERALLDIWPGRLLAIPHPASRLVTNGLYGYARGMLMSRRPWESERLALRQRINYVEVERL